MKFELQELNFHAIFYLFLSLISLYSIFYKSSFTLKLDFEKIEFQNMGISLISLGKGGKMLDFLRERGKGQFSPLFRQREKVCFFCYLFFQFIFTNAYN